MDSKGRPLTPEKPLWFSNIPLVASSHESVAPAAADGPPASKHRVFAGMLPPQNLSARGPVRGHTRFFTHM